MVANHNNMHLDVMTMVMIFDRPITLLIAELSLKHPFYKYFLMLIQIIITPRPIDSRINGIGKIIEIYDSTIIGNGTIFTEQVKIGELIKINGIDYEFQVCEIVNNTHLKVKLPAEFAKSSGLTDQNNKLFLKNGGYFILPKLDQLKTHEQSVDVLLRNQILVIFPEGYTQDQTRLIPLKAGASVFLHCAQEKRVTVPVICVGLNYEKAHGFRSKVVVNIGVPKIFPFDETKNTTKSYKYQFISDNLESLKAGLEEVKLSPVSYERRKTFACAKAICSDGRYYTIDRLCKFQLYHSFVNGFEASLKFQKPQELLSKIENLQKQLKNNDVPIYIFKKIRKIYSCKPLFECLKLLNFVVFVVLLDVAFFAHFYAFKIFC